MRHDNVAMAEFSAGYDELRCRWILRNFSFVREVQGIVSEYFTVWPVELPMTLANPLIFIESTGLA